MTAKDDARRMIEAHPKLHNRGWGQPHYRSDYVDLARERAELLSDDSLAVIVKVARWCRTITLERGRTSYGLKHDAERQVHGIGYVSNGQLIVAMLMAGYVIKKGGGFNPGFSRPRPEEEPWD
jgi:hypothetical protein